MADRRRMAGKKGFWNRGIFAITVLFAVILSGLTARAAEAGTIQAEDIQVENICYTNPSTGYQAIIMDEMNTLSGEDKAALLQSMEPLTKYGEAVYKTTTSSGTFGAERYLEIQYGASISADSGVLVLLDMGSGTFKVRCGGKMGRTVNNRQAESFASSATNAFARDMQAITPPKYAFEQVYARLEQARRALPVKYACNAMLALIIAMLINFVLVDRLSQMQKTSEQELMDNVIGYSRHGEVLIEFLTRTETYHPQTKR